MNAMPPKGLKPDARAKGAANSVHLTREMLEEEGLESPFSAAESGGKPANTMSPMLAGIEVRLSVEVGSLRLPLRDLMTTEPGQLFALDRMTSEPVSVLVNGKPFARGEIVAVGDRFGVRLIEIWPADHN